jgi:hypothetical protein
MPFELRELSGSVFFNDRKSKLRKTWRHVP